MMRLGVLFALALGACMAEPAGPVEVPLPDRVLFETAVYPILLRDCAFSECHGAPHRFFQVFGPGRTRLSGHPSDPDLVPREKTFSYERAVSMLVRPGGTVLERAPLLVKPLAVEAGGASHEGEDVFRRNLFQSTADPRYVTLLQWALTGSAPPPMDAVPPSGAVPPMGAVPPSGTVPPLGAGLELDTEELTPDAGAAP